MKDYYLTFCIKSLQIIYNYYCKTRVFLKGCYKTKLKKKDKLVLIY